MEGGNYVWLYVCEEELEKSWNSLSELDYNGKDLKRAGIKIHFNQISDFQRVS
jgi:hypothetical protein